MAILPTPIVDYSDIDFDSIRARLYNLIASAYPDWTEQSVASFGNILLELFAHVGDVLGFYLDARARETRITQAQRRESIVQLVKLLGYQPRGAAAAQVDVTFSLAAAAPAAVMIAAGRKLLTDDPSSGATFQLLTTVTIPQGELTATGTAEHSTDEAESFAANGRAYQELLLSEGPFIDRVIDESGETIPSEVVEANNGEYERVDSLLSSTGADRHYTLFIDDSERAHIRFGDGAQGQLPAGNIVVSYKVGGGARGNIEPGALKRVEGAVSDAAGNMVTVTVTNPAKATGGKARQSKLEIQREAPLHNVALKRTISREDFETNARRVPGVKRALMLTSNEVNSIGENRGRLYVVPAGGGTPSTLMKTAVHLMVTKTYPCAITFQVDVLNPVYLTVDVQATVFVKRGVPASLVDRRIRQNLIEYFRLTLDEGTDSERDNPTINFGYYLSELSTGKFGGAFALSDIQNVVRDTEGVLKLGDGLNDFLLNGKHGDLPLLAHQFPRLGKVILFNGETYAQLA